MEIVTRKKPDASVPAPEASKKPDKVLTYLAIFFIFTGLACGALSPQSRGVDVQATTMPPNPNTFPTATAPADMDTFVPPEATVTSASGETIYIVKKGEWLYDIGRARGLNPAQFTKDMIAVNPELSANPDYLSIGQRLRIPQHLAPHFAEGVPVLLPSDY